MLLPDLPRASCRYFCPTSFRYSSMAFVASVFSRKIRWSFSPQRSTSDIIRSVRKSYRNRNASQLIKSLEMFPTWWKTAKQGQLHLLFMAARCRHQKPQMTHKRKGGVGHHFLSDGPPTNKRGRLSGDPGEPGCRPRCAETKSDFSICCTVKRGGSVHTRRWT